MSVTRHTFTTSSHLVAHATRKRVIDAAINLAAGDVYDEAAFSALEAAMSLHRATVASGGQPPAAGAVVPFGTYSGQPVTQLPTGELQRLERYLPQALQDAAKRRFHAANLRLLGAIRAELDRRGRGNEAAQ
jgi:hypothetical protein